MAEDDDTMPIEPIVEEEADASGEDAENVPVEAPEETDAVEAEDDGEDDG